MSSRIRIGAALLGAGVLIGACSCQPKSSDEQSPEVVATVGPGRSITAKAFTAALMEQPPLVRSRYENLERRKELLDGLVRFELLAMEADRRRLAEDPEIQETIRKILVQRLVQKHADENMPPATDQQIREYYDAHLNEFVRPERVRTSQVLVEVTADRVASVAETEAATLLAKLKKLPPATAVSAFTTAAREQSHDPATRPSGGDLGFRTRDELGALAGPAFAEAAFALESVGALSNVVSGPKGYYLIQLTGRQAGAEQPLESVKPRIVARLAAERRSEVIEALVSSLRGSTKVSVNEDALMKIRIDAVDAAGNVPVVDSK